MGGIPLEPLSVDKIFLKQNEARWEMHGILEQSWWSWNCLVYSLNWGWQTGTCFVLTQSSKSNSRLLLSNRSIFFVLKLKFRYLWHTLLQYNHADIIFQSWTRVFTTYLTSIAKKIKIFTHYQLTYRLSTPSSRYLFHLSHKMLKKFINLILDPRKKQL